MTRTARTRLAALAGAAVMALFAAMPAAAAGRQPAAATVPTPVSLVITSVTPGYATPHGAVTVSGYLTNTTSTPLTGLSLQLWSASTPLASRTQLANYLSEGSSAGVSDFPVNGVRTSLPSLPAHATRPWSIKLRAADVGMTAFGAYPLAVQASQNGAALPAGLDRTFLPFYPPQPAHSRQQKLSLAWVWPLIDTPQQAVCRALLTDGLAAAIAPTGRLGRLLTAGASATGQQDQVTWAIDPSLLAGVSAMTRPFQVGGTPTCAKGSPRAASTTAVSWLAQLRAATGRSDYFVTPYADADVAALSHQGHDNELASAFSLGREVAGNLLGAAQRPAAAGSTAGTAAGAGGTVSSQRPASLGWIAWPPNGVADYGVLSSLAVNQVGTVVLDGSMMPPVSPHAFTPSDVTSTPTELATDLNVLLTDDGLDQILAAAPNAAAAPAPAAAGPPGVTARAAAFATEQRFLAETAMIVAESPTTARSIVVAPPRRWNPASGVAQALLDEMAKAPWVKPVTLAALAQAKPRAGQVPRKQPPQTSVLGQELRPALLRQVRVVAGEIQLQASILTDRQPHYLSAAVAAVESSAWRGSRAGTQRAEALLQRIQDYLTTQQRALTILDTPRATLGGKSGSVPVSISNGLRQSVTVTLKVTTDSRNRIVFGNFRHQVTVAAGTRRLVKIPVQSAVPGSTTLTIQLCNRAGQPLPGASATMTVEASHFGTLALVIIGIAFGVFVLASIARAIRGGGQPGEGAGAEDADADAAGSGEGGEDPPSHPNLPGYPAGPATVGAEQEDERAREEPDEHASARGRTEPR